MTNTLPGEWTDLCRTLPGHAGRRTEERITDFYKLSYGDREDVLRWMFQALNGAGVDLP